VNKVETGDKTQRRDEEGGIGVFVLILALVFALIVAVFALQNADPVAVRILWMVTEVPLVLIIFGSVLAGAAIVFLLALRREYVYRRKQPKPEDKLSKEVESSATSKKGTIEMPLSIKRED